MSDSRDVVSTGDLFLPTLLDRLSLQGKKAMTRSDFRKTVLRDLNWLLNCTNIERQLSSLQNFPQARESVINFGIPPLAGARFTESDLDEVAAGIQRALARFEPRILPKSLRVSVIRSEGAEVYKYNHARFRIEASYWFEPYPIDMVMRAHWDMETGGVDLREEQ